MAGVGAVAGVGGGHGSGAPEPNLWGTHYGQDAFKGLGEINNCSFSRFSAPMTCGSSEGTLWGWNGHKQISLEKVNF